MKNINPELAKHLKAIKTIPKTRLRWFYREVCEAYNTNDICVIMAGSELITLRNRSFYFGLEFQGEVVTWGTDKHSYVGKVKDSFVTWFETKDGKTFQERPAAMSLVEIAGRIALNDYKLITEEQAKELLITRKHFQSVCEKGV